VPWKEKTVEEKREEFVRRSLAKEKNKSALCREYGISRPTGDKWISRYQNGEALTDKSRAPFKHPNKTVSEIEAKILELRGKYPAIGAVKLRKMLERRGEEGLPCTSTVNAILKRNGCITAEASAAATPHKRFEKEQPNEMWQTDFKGDFLLADGKRCFPLCVLDDCSRFNLCIDAKRDQRRETVMESFERLFHEYGLPKVLLCDNGNPWGTAQSTGITLFEIWLMNLGVLTIHGRIRHPQTQGKEERFNGSLKRELLRQERLQNIRTRKANSITIVNFTTMSAHITH
jgi:transposase InsO family protein